MTAGCPGPSCCNQAVPGTEAECKPKEYGKWHAKDEMILTLVWVYASGLRRARLRARALQLSRGRARAAVVQRAERRVERGHCLDAQLVPCAFHALRHRARAFMTLGLRITPSSEHHAPESCAMTTGRRRTYIEGRV